MTDTVASVKCALRATARRWLVLAAEIRSHDTILNHLTAAASPALREGFGIETDTAAEMLIIFGDNPDHKGRMTLHLLRQAN